MAIAQPGKKEDAWDKVAKALSIANQGVGIVGGIQSIRKSSNDMEIADEAQDRIKKGIITPKEQLEYSKDYNVSESPSPGAAPLQDTQGTTRYYSAKTKAAENPGLMSPQAYMELKNKQFREVPVGTKGADTVYVPGPDGKPVAHAMMPPKFTDPNASTTKEPKFVLPNFDIVAGAKPTGDDVKEVKALDQARKNLVGTAERLRKLVEKHGTEVWPGKVREEMELLQGDLKLQIKDVAKLGQLTEGDMDIIRSQLVETTGLGTLFKPNANVKTGIDNMIRQANMKVDNAAAARGFKAKPTIDHTKFTMNGKAFNSAEDLQAAAQQELIKRNSGNAVGQK